LTNYSNQKTKGEAPDIYKLQHALLQAALGKQAGQSSITVAPPEWI
jgi:hypothetical protein